MMDIKIFKIFEISKIFKITKIIEISYMVKNSMEKSPPRLKDL